MNSQIRTALITAGFAGLLCGPMLRAQQSRRENAHVPFNFQVGSKVMTAGNYTAIEAGANTVIQLRDQASGQSVLVAAFLPKSGDGSQSKLTFRCYDDRCFLAEIWYAGENTGHGIPRSSREKELAASYPEKLSYVAMR